MVDTRDLISQGALAGRFGFGSSAITNWRRRFPDFPKPVFRDGPMVVLYRKSEVRRWLRAHARSWTR